MAKNINHLFLGSIALVILAGIFSILHFINRDTELDELFVKYFEAYQSQNILGASEEGQKTFAEAMKYYTAGEFGQSIKVLNAITSSDTAKAIHYFYLGNSLLALDKPKAENAKTAFREVFKKKEGFAEQSQWYLGLACLKNQEEDVARNILWEIARKGSGFKQPEARKIVDKLLEER